MVVPVGKVSDVFQQLLGSGGGLPTGIAWEPD
jgi:hypothetical protein